MYLLRKRLTAKSVAHIWTGSDTACRMYSTGGLNPKKYKLSKESYDLKICTMCRNVQERIGAV